MQQTIPVNDGYISSHVGATPSTGPFAVDFPFFSLNDVTVTLQADGAFLQAPLVRGADYDITGVATEDGSFSSGTVTLYIAVSNMTVIRFRTTPVERLSNFPLQGFFSRLALNAELNKFTVWMQDLTSLLGSTTEASRAYAPIVSPLFIGDPRAPTPPPSDNDTSIATTAFVQNLLVSVGAAIPSGVIADYAGTTIPAGWLACQGQTVVRLAYPGLFTAIGTTYNVGGEATTDFRLPDARGRVTASMDSGGSNRLNTVIPTSDTLGASGGGQTTALSVAQLPAHTHGGADHLHAVGNHRHTGPSGNSFVYGNFGNFWGYGNTVSGYLLGYDTSTGFMTEGANTSGADRALTTSATGSNQGHSVTQPTLIVSKIIKT